MHPHTNRRNERTAPRQPQAWALAGLPLLLTGLVLAGGAPAQTPSPASPSPSTSSSTGDSPGLEQIARDFLQPSLASSLGAGNAEAGVPLRPEVIVGALDRRLRLAPCARVEPHLPAGSRLWGRSRIGLRCVDGPTRWNVYLPVTVKAWGPAWVLRRPVSAGTALTQEDAEQAEIDWAEQASPVLASPALWVGQQAAYSLLPGQALRQHMVNAPTVFPAGAQVRVTQSGSGFQVEVSGQALGAGQVGQSARVRLPGGRVVTGLVRDGQTVELAL